MWRDHTTSGRLSFSGGRIEWPNPRGSGSREPARTTSRTSPSRFPTIGSPSSPASPAPAGLPPAELWASLTRRGFARVLVDGQPRDLAAPPPDSLDGAVAVVLDRLVLDAGQRKRLVESVESALREGGGQVAVELLDAGRRVFAEAFRCGGCGTALERPQPLLFSFNHPLGACAECKGFGNVLKYDEALVVPDRTRTLAG